LKEAKDGFEKKIERMGADIAKFKETIKNMDTEIFKYKTREEEQVKKIDEMKRDLRKAVESSNQSKSAMENF
jgi:peptidoglycan hydrolase CwlO-like protein